LATAFRLIQESVEKLKPGPLTLSCSSSVMMHWLIPRTAGFHQAHPEIKVQLNMNHGRVDFVRDNIGVAIRNTLIEAPKDARVRELTVERVGLVCRPTTSAPAACARRRGARGIGGSRPAFRPALLRE
jgi:LysR family transcriptional regulator, glycine cleavage system transcriptional activator